MLDKNAIFFCKVHKHFKGLIEEARERKFCLIRRKESSRGKG